MGWLLAGVVFVTYVPTQPLAWWDSISNVSITGELLPSVLGSCGAMAAAATHTPRPASPWQTYGNCQMEYLDQQNSQTTEPTGFTHRENNIRNNDPKSFEDILRKGFSTGVCRSAQCGFSGPTSASGTSGRPTTTRSRGRHCGSHPNSRSFDTSSLPAEWRRNCFWVGSELEGRPEIPSPNLPDQQAALPLHPPIPPVIPNRGGRRQCANAGKPPTCPIGKCDFHCSCSGDTLQTVVDWVQKMCSRGWGEGE
ncbi:hypothetical protein Acr_00g0001690 [Actinidia rufa]|uniref:Uncharacterized protein n=1 Tax=Actinidia rufa TaxID=165716 RepID=A0A7J0D6P1_9ERIC|nr:hypothetical protein Acr_00g0001690 [Actinidia rufa]